MSTYVMPALPVVSVLLLSLSLFPSPTEASQGRPGFLSQKILDEIGSYQDVVEQIVNYSLNGPGQNQSYNHLATFTDAFGSRLSGM